METTRMYAQMSQHLDPHFMLRVFAYLKTQLQAHVGGDQDTEALAALKKAEFACVCKTNLMDTTETLYRDLFNTEALPEALVAKRATVEKDLAAARSEVGDLMATLQEHSFTSSFGADKASNMRLVQEKKKFAPRTITRLYEYSRLEYEAGNYEAAHMASVAFIGLSADKDKTNSAYWGRLACEVLLGDTAAAMQSFKIILGLCDTRISVADTPLKMLLMRTWVLHWALFVYFTADREKVNTITEIFGDQRYLNVIQTSSPYLLRYFAAGIILSGARKTAHLREFLKICEAEHAEQDEESDQPEALDSLSRFLESLLFDYNFEAAQKELGKAEQLIASDYFLAPFQKQLIEKSRAMLFENYCKVTQRISIDTLAENLRMSREDAEAWIAKLISQMQLDAKIDSQAGVVLLNKNTSTAFQQVTDRTKSTTARTLQLVDAVTQQQ